MVNVQYMYICISPLKKKKTFMVNLSIASLREDNEERVTNDVMDSLNAKFVPPKKSTLKGQN